MSTLRGRGALAGYSTDSPIDLVSDDEKVQLPVASGPTRVQTTIQQPVRTYRTRAVTRAQAAVETQGIQTRSTPRAGMGTSVDPGSRAHARARTGNMMTTPINTSGSIAEIPRQNLNQARHTRSSKRNNNEAAAATKPASSNRELGADIRNWLIRTQKPTQFKTDRPSRGASEVPSLNPLSCGLLHTRKGVNSEVHAQASVPRHDLLANESGVGDQQCTSSGTPEIPVLPYRQSPSRAPSYGKEHLENRGAAATLLSQQSILTLNNMTGRRDAANLTTRNMGEHLVTPRPRMCMNPNDGAAAASPLSRQWIDQQDGAAGLSHEGTNRAARWDLQDVPSNMTNDKLSAIWSSQSTEYELKKPKGNEIFLRGLTSRGKFEEQGSALSRALPQQPVIERAVVTRHEETAVSLNMEAQQSSLDTSRTQRTMDRILPADRADTRGRDIADTTRHNRAILHEKKGKHRKRYKLRKQSMTSKNAGLTGIPVNTQITATRTSRNEHVQTMKIRKKGKKLEADVEVITGHHDNFKFWKQKAAKELCIGPEMQLISAAVAMFDKRQIQTVVPNRYLRAGASSQKQRRTMTFPGAFEILSNVPMTAIENAYKEHTAERLDTSRIVFWTDGSAAGGRRSDRRRGFAVTWRRSTGNGWGRWEAIGFQGMLRI